MRHIDGRPRGIHKSQVRRLSGPIVSAPKLHHYSPAFANARWAGATARSVCYYRNLHARAVAKRIVGKRQWGRKRKLYRLDVEQALGRDLESDVAPIYAKLTSDKALSSEERIRWAQFLFSQFVRTPCFMRYENAVKRAFNLTETPDHDRVGCPDCLDLHYLTSRHWKILVSHEDDGFIRTDNPAFLSDFPVASDAFLLYPLSPRLCFVACSAPTDREPLTGPHPCIAGPVVAQQLHKGGAFFINFHLARAADQSALVHPRFDSDITKHLLSEVLGTYPQPPFLLHNPMASELREARHSVLQIMIGTDRVAYPAFNGLELAPLVMPPAAYEES